MVTEGTSALVTAFPVGEGDAGARRLWELLGRLAGESGAWSGTQAELAAAFTPAVSVKTVGRWTAALRAQDILQTRGSGKALEYALLRWPQGAQPAYRGTVLTFTPRPTSDIAAATSDTTSDIESTDDVRTPPPTSDIESASRARFLSHHPHHPTSDISTSDIPKHHDPDLDLDPVPGTSDTSDTGTSDTRGKGDDGSGGGLTPWALLQVEFRLAPTSDMVDAWIALGDDGQRVFRALAAAHPAREAYVPPTWFWKVHTDAMAQAQGDRLRARTAKPAPTAQGSASFAVPILDAAVESPKPEPRAARSPWWHPFVMPAAVVCAALVLARRGGR
jgi:hypothetical protein